MKPGYVKLWRKTLDSGLLQQPTAWTLFGYILLNVSWEPSRYKTRYGLITLEAGQMATGRKKIAEETGLGEQSVRSALALLASMDVVSIKTTNGYSVITLKNWHKYQSSDQEKPTANQQLTTVKEVKEETPKTAASAAGREFTDWFYLAYEAKHGMKPSPPSWAFKKAHDLAKALGVDELKRRGSNFFADPWLTGHALEAFVKSPDTWATARTRIESKADARVQLDRKRTAL